MASKDVPADWVLVRPLNVELENKINKIRNTSCENLTSKSSKQGKWTSLSQKWRWSRAVYLSPKGRMQERMNRQKQSKREKDFPAKKKTYSWKQRIWFRSNTWSILLLIRAKMFLRRFGRVLFKVNAQLQIMAFQAKTPILFATSISFGENDQHDTYLWKNIQHLTKTQACKNLFFSLWRCKLDLPGKGQVLAWQDANLFGENHVWKVNLMIAQSINK